MELFEKIKDTAFIALSVVQEGNTLTLGDRYANTHLDGRLLQTPFDYILTIYDNDLGVERELKAPLKDSEKIYMEILFIEKCLNKLREVMGDYHLVFEDD